MLRISAGALIAGFMMTGAAMAQGWLQEIEVTQDPPDAGRRVLTVRLLPSRTAHYDELRFSCDLQQVYNWTDSRGSTTVKTNTPVQFTHRRPNLTLTDDLDYYANFRVPISYERLSKAYGEKTFRPGDPVTIPTIVIQARAKGQLVWEQRVPAKGTSPGAVAAPQPQPRQAPDSTGRDQVDLDG